MKTFEAMSAVLATAACGVFCASLLTGCGDSDSDTTPVVTTPTNAASSVIQTGAQAPDGDPRDSGEEHVLSLPPPESLEDASAELVPSFWLNCAPRMGLMMQGNSFKTMTVEGTEMYIDEIVGAAGALRITANADGTLTVVAKDFVSLQSGLVWKFKGFTINSEQNDIVLTNPLTLHPDDTEGTFRGYWNSYRPASR